jgi:hypothetical protein
MTRNGVKAIPFAHPDLNVWRSNFKGVRHIHKPTSFLVYGAPDDLWQEIQGDLILADYKATASKETITSLISTWQQGYKRQLELYGWLFKQNGFPVSRKSYIIYANARKDRDGFNGKLEFELTLIEHQGDDSWVEPALIKAKDCLMGSLPEPSEGCSWCLYRQAESKME